MKRIHEISLKAMSKKDPERWAAYMREWRKNNPDRVAEINRRRRENGESKKWHLKSKYGLSPVEREQMLAAQSNACAICRSADPGWKKGWVVDHCHSQGKVRGILCNPCNLILGRARDSVETLRRAIKYLKTHGGVSL